LWASLIDLEPRKSVILLRLDFPHPHYLGLAEVGVTREATHIELLVLAFLHDLPRWSSTLSFTEAGLQGGMESLRDDHGEVVKLSVICPAEDQFRL